MKKNYLLFAMLALSLLGYSQIGVNTENPKAFFHIDGAGDNEKSGVVTDIHQANDFVVTSVGKVGIGTNSPTNSLHIKSSSDPLKLEGLLQGDESKNSILSVDSIGVIKSMGTISELGLWTTKGNADTDSANNFLGTTNAQDLEVRTNNAERMRISAAGNVAIGTTTDTENRLRVGRNLYIGGSPSDIKFPFTINVGKDGDSYGNMNDNKGIRFITNSTATSNPFIAAITAGGTSATTLNENRYINFHVRTAADASDAAMTIRSYSATDKRVGIGNVDPTATLDVNGRVKATATSDPITLSGVVKGDVTTDQIIAVNPSGVVKTLGTISDLGIPSPTLFRLDSSITDFLSSAGAGGKQNVPMTLITNGIPGLSYDPGTATVTFPQGIYQIIFAYEATHNATNCTVSSYFVDFPSESSSARIHNTAAHSQGNLSNHGGSIIFSSKVAGGSTWVLSFGRGQSGNCTGAGMNLTRLSTHVLIFKIGNYQ